MTNQATYIEFKDGQKYASPDSDTSNDINAFSDAGYLLTDDDLIVDIDKLSSETIEQLISRFNIKTELVYTSRGIHLYFKKPRGFRGARSLTPLGFEVEYKHKGNTKAVTVKRNGEARRVVNHGQRETLPDIFRPCRKAENLLGLEEGDGRNEKLFKHRKLIEQYPAWKNYLGFINDYVFETPLPASEMESITREMSVQATENGETLIADTVIRDMKIVKYSGRLWFRPTSTEWYQQDDDELRRYILEYCDGQKMRYIEEVFNQIKTQLRPLQEEKAFDIRLNNGILRGGKFIDIVSDEFTPYAINLDYDPQAKPVPIVDEYLNNLTNNDSDYRKMIEEILGYTLYTDREKIRALGKFFFFVGDGGNGKGTLLEIIRKIVGTDNAGSLSIDELADERYTYSLLGKLVNLGDDVEDKPINEKKMKILKNISTADNISLRRMYENASTATLATTLIFTTNHILKSFEKGESYKRRVIWCPMYSKPKQKSPTFISEITTPEALSYWIRLTVEGYIRLNIDHDFTISKALQEFNDNYHEENNSVLEYLRLIEPDELLGKTSPDAYEEYTMWSEENDYNVQSRRLFKETISNMLGIQLKATKINGKTKRVFKQLTAQRNPQIAK